MSRVYNHMPTQKKMTKFGIQMEKVLQKRNISQTDLSRMLGYSKPAIHHWLYGLCEMRISTFAEIVDALQLSATEIANLLEVFWEDDDGK